MSVLDALQAGERDKGRGGRLSRLTPWLVSIGAHGAVIAAATLIVWSSAAPDYAPAPLVKFDDPGLAPAPLDAPEPLDDAEEIVEQTLPEIPDIGVRDAPVRIDSGAGDAVLLPEIPEVAAPEAPAPVQSRAEFAGLGASEARDIVYVVDASGSMITALPDVLTELRRSVSRLHPTQRFAVVLMQPDRASGDSVTVAPLLPNMRKPIVVDATSRTKRVLDEWLRTVRAGGPSNLLAGLQAALAMRPDAVFVLARISEADLVDADLGDLLGELERLNPADADGDRRTTIKTIQFLEIDPIQTLRRIGNAHGGGADGYTFLTLEDLARRLGED